MRSAVQITLAASLAGALLLVGGQAKQLGIAPGATMSLEGIPARHLPRAAAR